MRFGVSGSAGLIDEVRVYNRALTATEIQTDMTRRSRTRTGRRRLRRGRWRCRVALSSASLSWGAASDNVGVVRYNVHRGTSSGFTPSAGESGRAADGVVVHRHRGGGLYFYRVTAEDAAGNVGPVSNEASATVGDTQAPSAPGTLSAVGSVGKATLSWGSATDNVGVARYNVHRASSAGFTPSLANRIAQPTTTGYVDNTSPGSYFYKVTAEDAAGNVGPASNEAAATVTADTTAPSAPAALTAPVTGSTANLAWTASSDDVAVVRYNVHRGTSAGFTPSLANRIAQPTGTSYPDRASRPAATSTRSPPRTRPATPAPPPTRHRPPSPTRPRPARPAPSPPPPPAARSTSAGRRHRQRRRHRYNLHRGTHAAASPPPPPTGSPNQPASATPTPASPPAPTSTSSPPKTPPATSAPLTNTATATVADTSPPSTPTLNATGGAGQASLTWTAATDNVAVSRYNLHRSTTSGFTPTTANRIAQPTGTSHTDTGLTAGTYHYKLTAEDAAGNLSPASNQASATVTTPAPTGLVAAYGLDTGTGTTITDQSGTGNNGTPTQHHLGRSERRSATRSRSTARMPRQRPGLEPRSTSRRHDARGLGPPDDARQQLPHRPDEGAARCQRVRRLRERLGQRSRADRRGLHRRLPETRSAPPQLP